MAYKISEYPSVLPGYLENTELKTRIFYHTDLRENLEDILLKQGSEKEEGMLEKVFSDKSKTLKATVKALLTDIELRERLNYHLLNKIDDEICEQHTDLMQLQNLRVHYIFDRFMEVKNKKNQLEDNVLELEREKRREYLECFRDLMFLKKYLLSSLKDYWDLVKKRDLLSSDLSGINYENSKGS
jgi:hypothetical protein